MPFPVVVSRFPCARCACRVFKSILSCLCLLSSALSSPHLCSADPAQRLCPSTFPLCSIRWFRCCYSVFRCVMGLFRYRNGGSVVGESEREGEMSPLPKRGRCVRPVATLKREGVTLRHHPITLLKPSTSLELAQFSGNKRNRTNSPTNPLRKGSDAAVRVVVQERQKQRVSASKAFASM